MAKIEMAGAYERVFKTGGCSEQDRQAVLADLAEFSGFYSVSSGDSSTTTISRREGSREVFGRILSMIGMTDLERELLQSAARQESIRSQLEGEI